MNHQLAAAIRVTVIGGLLMTMVAGAAGEEPIILTPKPGPEPRINGPRLFGVRPGDRSSIAFPAPASGRSRLRSESLPAGCSVDAGHGHHHGKRSKRNRGEYVVTLQASNEHGAANKEFTIVVGDKLALTPPMGWNSWYTWYHTITDDKMRAGRRSNDRHRHGGRRLHVRQYRRLLDEAIARGLRSPQGAASRSDIKAVVGRLAGTEWRISDASQLPRHECDDGLHSRPRPAGRHLHVAGPAAPASTTKAAISTSDKMPSSSPPGASIFSSTIGVLTATSTTNESRHRTTICWKNNGPTKRWPTYSPHWTATSC